MLDRAWGRRVILTEDQVINAVATIGGRLNDAAWGRASWADVCKCFADAMPGSVPIIRNIDLNRRAMNSLFVEGMEPHLIASYHERYFTLDPWMNFIEGMAHGQISISEREHPSSSFRNSEFYNDWLAFQDSLKAATGIRIDVDAGNAVVVCWHYKVGQASLLDSLAAEMLNRLKPDLINAVRSAAMLRHGLERTPKLGHLIEHIAGGAILIDATRQICEANCEATTAMERGELYSGASQVLTLRDQTAQRWLEDNLSRLLASQDRQSVSRTFQQNGKVLRIIMTRAYDYGERQSALLIRPRPYVLVVIKSLTGNSVQLDIEALRLAFALSGAEAKLCELLVNGLSLAEAAEQLHISLGTVRQRTKALFHKTGTHRQGELIALATHFAATS